MIYFHTETLQKPLRPKTVIGTEQTHRILLDGYVKSINVLTLQEIGKVTLVTELVTIIFVGSDFQFQDSALMGIVFYFEKFYEITLNEVVLAHLAFRQIMTRDGNDVGCASFNIIVNGSNGDKQIFSCCYVVQLVDIEAGHERLSVLFQYKPVIELDLPSQNTSEVFSKDDLSVVELLCHHSCLMVFLEVFVVALHLQVFLPNLLVLVQLIVQPVSPVFPLLQLTHFFLVFLDKLLLVFQA